MFSAQIKILNISGHKE